MAGLRQGPADQRHAGRAGPPVHNSDYGSDLSGWVSAKLWCGYPAGGGADAGGGPRRLCAWRLWWSQCTDMPMSEHVILVARVLVRQDETVPEDGALGDFRTMLLRLP